MFAYTTDWDALYDRNTNDEKWFISEDKSWDVFVEGIPNLVDPGGVLSSFRIL